MFFGCDKPKTRTIESIKEKNNDFYDKCRKLVLGENHEGQEYFFSRKVEGVDEIIITYLGNIITAQKDTLKVVNSVNFSGQLKDARRGSGNVFIYDNKNERIGFYYVGAAGGIPSKVENGSLIFSYSNESCNQSTAVSLCDSIPQQIFIKCTEKGGDLYSFTNGD